MSLKILKNNCCGLDVHKTWIYACIGITDFNGRTEYKQARFSSLNNPVPVSLLSGDRKPQIRFLGNHHSGSGNLYHKSFRM